jgi:hypothetical protein
VGQRVHAHTAHPSACLPLTSVISIWCFFLLNPSAVVLCCAVVSWLRRALCVGSKVFSGWKLPGGYANLGEEFGAAACREVRCLSYHCHAACWGTLVPGQRESMALACVFGARLAPRAP